MLDLASPIAEMSRVGKSASAALARLGLRAAADLLWHLPVRHDDLSRVVPIAELVVGETATVHGRVELIASRRSFRRRMVVTEAVVADDTGQMKVVWFHQPYVSKILTPGTRVSLAGKVDGDTLQLAMVSPTYERLVDDRPATHTGRLVPVYPATDGASQKQIRFLVNEALPLAAKISDPLPDELRQRYSLDALNSSLQNFHFPADQDQLDKARQRLAFDELLLLTLRGKLAMRASRAETAPAIEADIGAIKQLVASLPFTLTDEQRSAAWQIIQDMATGQPMQRLLQGDVGSGKTVVAAIACLAAAKAGYQACLLAPTAVLAEQHWATITKVLAGQNVGACLLTASCHEWWDGEQTYSGTKADVTRRLKQGKILLAVGTHALLTDNVEFKNLALVVVDEQHRFGVHQRAALRQADSTRTPHLLSMTATPIPRTLALLLYGQLESSTLRQKPAGRQAIATSVLPPHRREDLYQAIAQQVAAGRQAFIVCPRVAEADTLGIKAATAEFERLSAEVFPKLRLGLLHGQLKPAQKTAAMKKFSSGETDILVTTTVIEVGVDIPNATVMAIEGAERFGLAQLHQLRGRVGRGQHPGQCFLLCETGRPDALQRLQLLERYDDGFTLAEADLKMRGPGQLLGTEQSGQLAQLRVASLTDQTLIRQASSAADELLDQDPTLASFPALQQALERFEMVTHLE
jgi:ATP-dependent DNA helicase RecG